MWMRIQSLIFAAALLGGCSTVMPVLETSSGNWQIIQAQAVWNPSAKKSAIAGDLIISTGPNNQSLIQFAKTPFTILTASKNAISWGIEFQGGYYKFSGRNQPPPRFIWFYLPQILDLHKAPVGWQLLWKDSVIHLARERSGETLDIYLLP